MNSGLRIARAAGALAAAAWLLASPASAATKQVSANASNTFAPATVDVNAGDTVKWTNVGGLGHTVTASSSNWTKDDRITTMGDSTSFRFTKAGTFRYVCSTHRSLGMAGTVVVHAAPKPPPPTHPSTSTPPPPPPTTVPPSSPPATTTPSATPPTGSATPPPLVSESPAPPTRTAGNPSPSILPEPPSTPYLGTGGLTPPAPSGRDRGLPVMVALILIGGVGSAELRTVLANAP